MTSEQRIGHDLSPECTRPASRGSKHRRGLAAILLLAHLGACDADGPPRPPERPARPTRPMALGRSPQGPAAAQQESAPPLPDAVARCVAAARRDAPSSLVGALALLGEQSLFEDGCRVEIAPRARDFSLCATVAEGPLRTACLARTAMVAAAPDRCPQSPGVCGRDPVCVAVAARAPALCTAAMLLDRPTCEALCRGDDAPCASLDPEVRPRCLAESAALRGLLPAQHSTALPAGRATLTLSTATDAGAPTLERPLRTVHRGVFLDVAGTVWLVDPVVGARVSPSLVDDQVALAARIFSPRTHGTLSAQVRLAMPDNGGPERASDWIDATATLTRSPHARGDRIAGELSFVTVWHGQPLRAVVRFESFVRDVIDAAALESPTN